ncbi:MAG TPA: hypothetical protein VGI43_07220 [Mucilaginibacter sp.]
MINDKTHPYCESYFEKVIESIDKNELIIPKDYNSEYFPDFIAEQLDRYVEYYEVNRPLIFKWVPHLPNDYQWKEMLESIKNLSKSIKDAINLYFNGDIFKATELFNNSLDYILFDDINPIYTVPPKTIFYRSRKSEHRSFGKCDMFHVKFEERNKISTNRYSIPGLPALYLGESTYVCWEESDRYRLRDLWFSRIENQEELKVIKIQRFDDLLREIENIADDDKKLSHLCAYLIIYPLIVACTIKVKDEKNNFTPQYIIPQLLLQYIAKFKEADKKIDGIMYLSSQVNYSKIDGVKSYNYVFPVKASLKNGFCEKLSKTFHISEPTSLEIEEIIHNPKYPGGANLTDGASTESIELSNGIKSFYFNMSFGRLEQSLAMKQVTEVTAND